MKSGMANEGSIMTWTFYEETDVPKEVEEILIEGETAEAAYKTVRDVAVVTNKRIIIADRQGITGKKWKSTPFHLNRLSCILLKMEERLTLMQNSNYGLGQGNSNYY